MVDHNCSTDKGGLLYLMNLKGHFLCKNKWISWLMPHEGWKCEITFLATNRYKTETLKWSRSKYDQKNDLTKIMGEVRLLLYNMKAKWEMCSEGLTQQACYPNPMHLKKSFEPWNIMSDNSGFSGFCVYNFYFFGWCWLIKLYRFLVYNSIILHLCIAFHLKSRFLPSPYIPPLLSYTSCHPLVW